MHSMIDQSFIFLDRIHALTERKIWQHAADWGSFLQTKGIPGISPARKLFYDRRLKEAENALEKEDVQYFSERLPLSETWRLYEKFKDDALFLDIETDINYGNITVIGVSDGDYFKAMVRGFNLSRENLLDAFQTSKLLITFNGASFDVPVIERYFGMRLPKIPHIDLRHVCSKVGLKGGLKSIERQVGIRRTGEAEGVTGADAVWLWQQFMHTKSPDVLQKLIDYNQADVENMKELAEIAIPKLWKLITKKT